MLAAIVLGPVTVNPVINDVPPITPLKVILPAVAEPVVSVKL